MPDDDLLTTDRPATPPRAPAARARPSAPARRGTRIRPFCRAALADAAAEQGLDVEGLIALIDARRGRSSIATAAERFVAAYFHVRATAGTRHPGLRDEPPLLETVLDRLA